MKGFGKGNVKVDGVNVGCRCYRSTTQEVLMPELRAKIMAAKILQRDLLPEEVARADIFLAC